MKLFYTPGACSLAPHIVINELGLDVETVKVDLRTHQTEAGEDFYQINPKGYVPALQLDNGEMLTEAWAILLYLADQSSAENVAQNLLPAQNTFAKYKLYEWLAFVSSEVHKGLSGLFNPAVTEDQKTAIFDKVFGRLAIIDQNLADKDYLMGDNFSVADAYLFTCSRWLLAYEKNFDQIPNFKAYFERVMGREAVQKTLHEEGLI